MTPDTRAARGAARHCNSCVGFRHGRRSRAGAACLGAGATSARACEPRTRGRPRACGQHRPGDLASDLYQEEFDEGLADDLRGQLAAVERAEARLSAGTYGLSIVSGKPIPDDRLEAIPAAELTVEEERAQGSA